MSKATYRKIIQNLWWATGYNIFAIPLAAGGLASWGIVLPGAMSAVLMSLSAIVSPSTPSCCGARSCERLPAEFSAGAADFCRVSGIDAAVQPRFARMFRVPAWHRHCNAFGCRDRSGQAAFGSRSGPRNGGDGERNRVRAEPPSGL